MSRREELGALLKTVANDITTYYQPPSNIQLNYPCIIYRPAVFDSEHANDKNYLNYTGYRLTIISRRENSFHETIKDLIAMSEVSTMYTKDNLYHTIMTVY